MLQSFLEISYFSYYIANVHFFLNCINTLLKNLCFFPLYFATSAALYDVFESHADHIEKVEIFRSNVLFVVGVKKPTS